MGKKHFSSEDKADRRGGRSAGGPGGFGNGGRPERSGPGGPAGRGGERERGGYSAARPGNGRPPTNGAFGRPANGAFVGGGKFGGAEKRPFGAGGREGGGFGNKSFGSKEYGARDGGFRPGTDRPDRPRLGKEQRTGTSYGRSADRPERGSFGAERPERGEQRGPVAPDARPIRPYQPQQNWNGQPYRRDGVKAVPRGEPGERNRKFQKQNPFEPGDSSAPRNPGSFGRSTPRESEAFARPEERGPNRPIRSARPFGANPPQPREERPERRDTGAERDRDGAAERRADEAAFGRKFTPGAFGKRAGTPPVAGGFGASRSTGERPGSYEKRAVGERWTPAPGSFAERR